MAGITTYETFAYCNGRQADSVGWVSPACAWQWGQVVFGRAPPVCNTGG